MRDPISLSLICALESDRRNYSAAFACITSAIVLSAIGSQPLLSILTSVIYPTAMLGFLHKRLKGDWEALQN